MPLPRHARAELRLVVLAAAHLADARHDPCRAFGHVLLQPVLEQRVHLPGQAQHDAEGRRGAGLAAASRMRSSSGSFRNGITGDTLTPTGMPAAASARWSQPPLGRCGTRLHHARQLRVERGDRHVDRGQPPCRHRRDEVDVAFDAGRLGDQRKRMVVLGQHLDHLSA
jgi:hypothetical protein